jgi:TRAP-type C4-dicarboxylate transport system permease small subunit
VSDENLLEEDQLGAEQIGAQHPFWIFTPLKLVAAAAIFAMSVLTFVDVLGRYLFSNPIPGTFEIVGLLLGVVAFSGLPIVSCNQSHITVDLFDNYIRGRFRRVRAYVVLLGTALMVAFIGHRLLMAGLDEAANDFVTENLGISRAPLIYVMAALAFLTCVLLLHMCWRGQFQSPDPHQSSGGMDDE